LDVVKADTPTLLSSKHQVLAGGNTSLEPQVHSALQNLSNSLESIIQTMRVQPEFAVLFEVDYIDDELGHKLAALAQAVRDGDRLGVGKGVREVDQLVKEYATNAKKSAPADPKVHEAIARAEAALPPVGKTAKEAVALRVGPPGQAFDANAPPPPEFFPAEQRVNTAIKDLKEAVSRLPGNRDRPKTQGKRSIPLLQAAQLLSKNINFMLDTIK